MEQDKYIKDIEIIKDILIKQKKTPIIESWAFFVWSFLVVVGSISHFVIFKTCNIENSTLIPSIWVPISLLGLAGETLGWLKSKQKNSIYIFSNTNLALIFTLVILTIFGILFLAILNSLDALHLVSFLLAGLIGLAMGFLGTFITSKFYYVSISLITLTTILFFIPLENEIASLICGILIAAAMFSCGLINRFVIERKKNVS
ncbi:MAG: hypothetical protein JXR63_00105 [Spirochaetales bacterium]|nr:hypothetical protein [Spirochaetales bacterium]